MLSKIGAWCQRINVPILCHFTPLILGYRFPTHLVVVHLGSLYFLSTSSGTIDKSHKIIARACLKMAVVKTMKAVQIQKFNAPYDVSQVEVPRPKPYQVLVRIKAAGFCHTDLMALNNEFHSTLPFIGSHEPAGVIEEVGSSVTGFETGDRVGCINFETVCGSL